MKKFYGHLMIGIICILPFAMIISYFTYTEKIVLPILLVILGVCMFKLRKEL